MTISKINNFPISFTLADGGLSWILFFSIVYQKLAPIGFMIMFISLFFQRYKSSKHDIKSYFLKGPAIWFIFYYLLLLIGMIWSENIPFGMQKLENKLTFLLFPVLYFFSAHKWGKSEWKELIIWSLFFVLIIYELMAFWRFFSIPNQPWGYQFMESRFTLFMHRSYFACYLVIGIVLLIENLLNYFSKWRFMLLLFFSIGIFQTGSKAGIVSLLLIVLVYIIKFAYSNTWKHLLPVISVFIFLTTLILFTNNPVKSRFTTTWSALNHVKLKENYSVESNTARILMWNTSMDVWKGNFLLGVGTGDYDDELTKMNIKYNNHGVAEERLNSHNQFLNTGVQLGLIGFFILTMIFTVSFYVSEKRLWQLLILLVFFINFLVESFLETQAGIVLFCTLLLLFFSRENKAKLSISEQ
jgi:O-antigen ligase